jgi:hypothetical protein
MTIAVINLVSSAGSYMSGGITTEAYVNGAQTLISFTTTICAIFLLIGVLREHKGFIIVNIVNSVSR